MPNTSRKRRHRTSSGDQSIAKRKDKDSYMETTLNDAGLVLSKSGDKHVLKKEPIVFVRCLKDVLERNIDYPTNVKEFIEDFKKLSENVEVFKSFLTVNVFMEEETGEKAIQDCVAKILLSLECLQVKLMAYLFERATEFAIDEKPIWIQLILKSFFFLDNLVSNEKLSTYIVDLLDVSGHACRLEVILTLPDIIADRDNRTIQMELSRYISEDYELIPAILECFSYLHLATDLKHEILTKMLLILERSAPFKFFPNLVKFLLCTGANETIVNGLRCGLDWSFVGAQKEAEISTSKMLSVAALRTAASSSKLLSLTWLKIISNFKSAADYKPLDFLMLLVLHSTSKSREKTIENLIKKQIHNDILRSDILKSMFKNFHTIMKDYLNDLLHFAGALLKSVPSFTSILYIEMFMRMEDSRHAIVAALLQLQGSSAASEPIDILSTILTHDIALLQPHSLKLLTLIDKIEDLNLNETRKIMHLLCALAYGTESSILRNDIHMIILKQLSRSDPIIKAKGIISGVLAAKYLIASHDDRDESKDSDRASVHLLPDGPIKDAATLIELVSKNCLRHPEFMNLFHDEFAAVLASQPINKTFLSWLFDAITNDLQNNFIYDVNSDADSTVKTSLKYCLNSEDEQRDVIAINVMEYSANSAMDSDIRVLPSMFRLMRIVHHLRNDGDLSSIDALLGCAVLMPSTDNTIFEDSDREQQINTLNAMIHCANWFRELINGFADQTDKNLREKVMHRLRNLETLEENILSFLLKISFNFHAPIYNLACIKSNFLIDVHEVKAKKPVPKKKTKKKDDVETRLETQDIPPTAQLSEIEQPPSAKYGHLRKEYFRDLDFITLVLLNDNISTDDASLSSLRYLLEELKPKLRSTLASERKSPLSKPKAIFNECKKPEELIKSILAVIPRVALFLDQISKYVERCIESCDGVRDAIGLITKTFANAQKCLETLFDFLNIFFAWSGFTSADNQPLLKRALHIIAKPKTDLSKSSVKILIKECCNRIAKFKESCLQITTAVSLVKLLQSLLRYHSDDAIVAIVSDTCFSFLQLPWRDGLGALERGLAFNQSVDRIIGGYFTKPNIETVKSVSAKLREQAPKLQSKNDVLATFHCIGKLNFPLIFRGTCSGLCEAAKNEMEAGLTDNEHLELWKNVAIILKTLTEIVKLQENRINLSIFLKKSLPLIKLFLSQGMPIMEMQLKREPDLVIEVLRLFQHSTRFLHSLCCHSLLNKDTSLIAKVPEMKSLLGTMVCKVKAALAANDCREAFWMGNLKNKNIQGEVILSQSSNEDATETPEGEDELPDDDDSLQSDDELLNPGSKSISDII